MRNQFRERLGTTAAPKRLKVPSGSLWPNGEFGLGYCQDMEETVYEDEYGYTQPDVPSGYQGFHAECEGYLTLSDVPNSHKHGLKGLTTLGARMVRSGCYLMEQRLGREDCMMWTLTVPTLSLAGRKELARNWGKLTNRLVQQLSRLLTKSGRPPAIVGVTEIQTGRLERYREGYLHLHLLLPGHSNKEGRWAVSVDDVRSWWHSALERFSGESIPSLPRIQAEVVRKSAEGYMGKYLSKGSGDELKALIEDLGEDSVPGQWWFCSSLMREKVKAGTCSGRNAGTVLEAFIQYCFETGDMDAFVFIRHVDVVVDGTPYTAGWYGKLREDVAKDLLDFLHAPADNSRIID